LSTPFFKLGERAEGTLQACLSPPVGFPIPSGQLYDNTPADTGQAVFNKKLHKIRDPQERGIYANFLLTKVRVMWYNDQRVGPMVDAPTKRAVRT
jgi:hypothetical protein